MPSLLPALRPYDWPGQDRCWSRPLAALPQVDQLPLVTLSEQRGPLTTFAGPERLAYLDIDAAQAERQALENLGRADPAWRWVETATPSGSWLELYIVEGHLAAERILDYLAMEHAQDMVGRGKPLAVGIPHSGMLLTAGPHAAASGDFTALVHSLFVEPASPGAEPLTPLVFVLDQSRIIGHAG